MNATLLNHPITTGVPLPFSALSLSDALINNLSSLGYEKMTPIQAESLPMMLNRRDVIAQAKTGSGKTAAFGLTLLHHLNREYGAAQALVLCPTRELAEQVTGAIRKLARLMPNVRVLNLSGGMPLKPQLDSLKKGTHIIVGTPGRVQKHLDKGSLLLNHLQTLVLDEADRMLDMGFFAAIQSVIAACPETRQTLLFSATYPPEIQRLASKFMREPQRIIIEETLTDVNIEQQFYEATNPADKILLLKALLQYYKPISTLIFCNTKDQTTHLSNLLSKEGFSAIALNGDMEQLERDVALIRFGHQSCSILVATDVAARGLDIKELPAVINFDLAFDHDIHLHRIGRTGRAGSRGLALSLTIPADAERLCAIEMGLKTPLIWGDIQSLNQADTSILAPAMVTFALSAGRKDKIRPGDVLGALTKDAGLLVEMIGKITVTAMHAYVSIHQSQADKAYQYFQNGKLKGRKIHVKRLR